MPAPGDSLSRFRLVEKIGDGGTGSVWRARDTTLDRDVALKILPTEVTTDPERLAAFEGEAKIVAGLDHPGIVTIHSVENVDGTHFITMELVRGRPLGELIPPDGFPLPRLLEIALPILDAVGSAHDRGVVHRDLKPANVMVGDDGRVKVLDFGLAQIRQGGPAVDPDDLPTRTLTMRSEIRGTLPYMSPEQLQDKPLDHRTDVFSLGVVFYEMATGRRPFRGDTPVELIASILRDYPRSVIELNPSLPAGLQRAIAHSMQKDRERRMATVRELRKRLEDLGSEDQTAPIRMVPAAVDRGLSSVAVLPLHNHSTEQQQDFFSDGMTEALITGLAKIEGLKVISRTSVMQYKGTLKPVHEIASELGVGAIVEGSVLRIGDRVRINAQLIDARTDEHLWAESYDREIRDLFALQRELAQAIAGQVRVTLTARDEARLDVGRPVNPEAQEAYLKGRHFWYQRTPESVKKGLAFFERATRLDPGFALAWAGIADSHLVGGGGYLGLRPEAAYTRAREAAAKAIELDDRLAEGHTSYAGVLTDYDWKWAESESAYRRAIELNPNYSTARFWFADHLVRLGRFDEAIGQARRALETDPLASISNFMLSWVLFFARRYADAVDQAHKTLELDSRYVPALRLLGWAHEEMGAYEEAIVAHRRASELSSGSLSFRAQIGRAYALSGRSTEARPILEELTRVAESERIGSHDLAVLHTALGAEDLALHWLAKACDEREDHVPYLMVNPRLDPLRGERGFADLLKRIGLDR